MKIAIVGSGLSALGALSVLEDKKFKVDLYKSIESPEGKVQHRIYFNKGKIGIHKSVESLEKLSTTFAFNNQLKLNSGKEICGLLTSNYIGGLSNFWGGSSHKILDFENIDFVNAGLDLSTSYEAMTNYLDNEKISDDSYETYSSKNKSSKWLNTTNLFNKNKNNIFSSVEFLKSKKSINQLEGQVLDIKQLDNKVRIFFLRDNLRSFQDYDYIIVAAGSLASPILASRLIEEPLCTELQTNEQRIFIASYELNKQKMSYLRKVAGPPSILISDGTSKFYVQMYPIKKFFPLEINNSLTMNSKGYLIGYIYHQSHNSNKIKMEFDQDNLNLNILENKNIVMSNKFLKKTLKREGVKLISPIFNLVTGSSQHISSGLAEWINKKNETSNRTKHFYFKEKDRVLFVDTSVFPYTPLCTIGLTAMAASRYITKQFFSNL